MTARAYCGCTSPNVPPVPRDAVTIGRDVANAAERLDVIAYRVFMQPDDTGERETTELDALAVGIARLACELRMRQHGKDGAPCHD
jgi:hypothetical protein